MQSVEGSPQAVEQLTRAVEHHGDDVLLLLASFDGVLADYQQDPDRAQIPRARLALLHVLQRLPGVVVAIVSGRPLDDLRTRAPVGDRAFFIGLHGLDIVGPGYRCTAAEALEPYRRRMAEVAAQVGEVVADVPGVRLECKGPIVALHTREAASRDVVWSRFQLLSAAADLVNSAAVRALRGQDVLELLPNIGSSRANAVLAVERRVAEQHRQSVFTVYIGPDWADDDAAAISGDGHVAAVVGRRIPARYHLDSPGDLESFLRHIIACRSQ